MIDAGVIELSLQVSFHQASKETLSNPIHFLPSSTD